MYCYRAATELQQSCNRAATELQQSCNSEEEAATLAAETEPQRAATELQQCCNSGPLEEVRRNDLFSEEGKKSKGGADATYSRDTLTYQAFS